ncbi:hypothetical protein M1615_01575 [Patescibacteria group bacterium]|nr:hypothetical protein [Patescibacteria group bacterium]MCL5010277.1 hypothetical protein [Patescibacteria group bacterium]
MTEQKYSSFCEEETENGLKPEIIEESVFTQFFKGKASEVSGLVVLNGLPFLFRARKIRDSRPWLVHAPYLPGGFYVQSAGADDQISALAANFGFSREVLSVQQEGEEAIDFLFSAKIREKQEADAITLLRLLGAQERQIEEAQRSCGLIQFLNQTVADHQKEYERVRRRYEEEKPLRTRFAEMVKAVSNRRAGGLI